MVSTVAANSCVVPLPQALGERIDVLPTVDSLRQLILDSEEEMDRERRLPEPLVDALDEAGIFRTWHPREFGGLELHTLDYMQLVYELARINGSVAWIATIHNGAIPLLPPDLMAELREQSKGLWRVSGSHGRIGKAVRVEGGYRFTGDWVFATGAPWASHITATVYLVDENNEPVRDPDTGFEVLLDGIFPRDAVNYRGNWNSIGLRGTASGEFSLDDVFIEERFAFSFAEDTKASYSDRPQFRMMPMDAGVCLGIARGMLDAVIELASQRAAKQDPSSYRTLGTTESHQIKIAQADTQVRAAWEFAKATAERAYDLVFDGDEAAQYERGIVLVQATLHAVHVAKQVSTTIFDIAGADSLFPDRGIERRFRDVQTAGQHTLFTEHNFAPLGLYYLTRDRPGGPEMDSMFGPR
jgi:alkylation response protein AidB-like acyl-CoA dehydrogenase